MLNNLIFDKASLSVFFFKKTDRLTKIKEMMLDLEKDEDHVRETFINSAPEGLKGIAKAIINKLIDQGVALGKIIRDGDKVQLTFSPTDYFFFENLEDMKKKLGDLEKSWIENVTIKINDIPDRDKAHVEISIVRYPY